MEYSVIELLTFPLKTPQLVKLNSGAMNRPKVQRRIGKYEVGKTIGQGTFAKVRYAKNTETGESVALKILDKEKVLKNKMSEQVKTCFTLLLAN